MAITLDLTPEMEAQLREKAARIGLEVDAYVRRLVEGETPSALDAENETVIRLLEKWRAEDAAMTPEETEEAETDWQELRACLNANRAATGERTLFP